MKQYADWKAPKSDQSHLIWPDPGSIIAHTLDNARHLGVCDKKLQHCPISDLRQQMRRHLKLEHGPLIATGHQVEMYHPGVWAKNVLIDRIARKMQGRAVHFAVDTDTPKHLQLKWPDQSRLMSDDPEITQGEWSGLVRAPTPEYLGKLIHEFDAEAREWDFSPAIQPFFQGMRENVDPQLRDRLLAGATRLDQSLGLDVQFIPVTQLIDCDPYFAYVHHIVADIEQFAHQYNHALADYRSSAGIQSTTRPMPDLLISQDHIELPFWADDLATHDRNRATAIRVNGGWAISGGDDHFIFDRSLGAAEAAGRLRNFLESHELRLSPRALTLTLFFRLLVVDQFVHGIGGARYDQVSDILLERYFGVQPPAFSVTTATLYFPDAGEQVAACVPCVVSEGHRLRHNLLPAKRDLLQAIDQAPRKSIERKNRYLSMHREIASTAVSSPKIVEWKSRLNQTIAQRDLDATRFDRELFYGIQSVQRLTALIKRYAEAFDAV